MPVRSRNRPACWALASLLSLVATILLPFVASRGQEGFAAIGTAAFIVLIGSTCALVFALAAALSGWRRRDGAEAAPRVYTWGPLLLWLIWVLLLFSLARSNRPPQDPAPGLPKSVTAPVTQP